jgi:hypothetical protein
MRRVRPIVASTLFKYFDFRIMPDFGEGSAVLQDGYFDVTYFKPSSNVLPLVSGTFAITKRMVRTPRPS